MLDVGQSREWSPNLLKIRKGNAMLVKGLGIWRGKGAEGGGRARKGAKGRGQGKEGGGGMNAEGQGPEGRGSGIQGMRGLARIFYRKGNSVKRSGPFSEPLDSENWKVAAVLLSPHGNPYPLN